MWAPAGLWFVDSAESSFILEHQPDVSFWLAVLGVQYTGFNFFEASQASLFAAFGCLERGIFLLHPFRSNTLYTNLMDYPEEKTRNERSDVEEAGRR